MMKRSGWLALALVFALGGTAFAADSGSSPSGTQALPASAKKAPTRRSWLKTWFEHLKQGLSESAVEGHYQKRRVTAVAAVRGAKQDSADPEKPTWKSSSKRKLFAEMKKERQEFAAAVELILEGKTKEGIEALDAFEKAYPESKLLKDVEEAREKAKEYEAAQAKAGEEEPSEVKETAGTQDEKAPPPADAPEKDSGKDKVKKAD